jgi:tRNA-dihydrouridine synthase B
MGWYLGHFPGAKQVRNELVHINSLADVDMIIHTALQQPDTLGDEIAEDMKTHREDAEDTSADLLCIL